MTLVAVGIIISEGRVLACQRRRNGSYPLKWEFPGGKIEDGEEPEVALVRELQEELGIDVTVESEFHMQEWVYRSDESASGENDAYRVFYYLIRSFTGTPVNRAFEQIAWVTPKDLAVMDILEGNRGAVERLVGIS